MTSLFNMGIMGFIYSGIAVILALSFHELSHGWVSYLLGDETPKKEGRLSLNPLAHLDPIGTICLFLFHFGWAKPVHIDHRNYKNEKLGTVLVSLVGPMANFVMAFIAFLILKFIPFNIGLAEFLSVFAPINVGLGVFNLIPIPPLDGSKVLYAILPSDMYFKYMQYEQYGFFILMILLAFNVLTPILSVMTGVVYSVFDLLLSFI